MRIPAPVRFVGIVLGLVLVFGACGSFGLGALDKAQTHIPGDLTNLGYLFQRVGHFLQVLVSVPTTATDRNGVPLRNYLLAGLARTIEFCFISMPLAILLGFVLALMSRARLRILRVPARAYVEFIRNTPLLVQMLAIYWSLSFLPPWYLNAFTAGIATLALNYAAYECENIRAGLAAIDRGQGEAASALGLSWWQSLRLVEIPQTISVVLAPVLNDFIFMFKDSSILSLITIVELTSASTGLGRRIPSFQWQFIVIGALIYLALSLPMARLARTAENRLRSTAFVPQGNLTVTAVQVLGISVLVGLIAAVLADGVSAGTALGDVAQLFAALALTLMIILFILVVLGGIVYIPAALLGRGVRRDRAGTATPELQPAAVVSK
jgi:His/Glu/Gln/Arg/opine family amino acid ABC transporter permease subunit